MAVCTRRGSLPDCLPKQEYAVGEWNSVASTAIFT
jgi:hypothetical protein